MAVTFTLVGLLAFQDFKSRELSAVVVYAYTAISAGVFLVSLLTSEVLTLALVYAGFSLLVTAGLFMSLFKLGLIGDGDVFVAIALGFMFFHPSVYELTLPRAGVLPPSLVIVFYAALASIASMAVNAILVLAKYTHLLKAVETRAKIVLPLVGKPIKLLDYVSGKFKHYYPLQEYTLTDTGLSVKYKFLTGVEGENVSKLKKLVENGILDKDTYVWVTPGLPFVSYLFVGVVLLLVLGDRPLTKLLTWFLQGL